jgi:hypothetical protein
VEEGIKIKRKRRKEDIKAVKEFNMSRMRKRTRIRRGRRKGKEK